MSSCIEQVDDYMLGKTATVIQTKTSLIVAIFFTYIVYAICLFAKYVLAGSTNEKYAAWSKNLGRFCNDIVGKNIFMFMLLMVTS